jgi:2-keto-4-pentenoate hydratase
MADGQERDARISAAATLLEEARRSGKPLPTAPADLEPRDDEEAMAVHFEMIRRLKPIVAWKVGAASAQATPACGAITADTCFEGPTSFPANFFNVAGMEAEIAVRFAEGLPARAEPYSETEVLAAIGTWHAAIEVVDSAFAGWPDVSGRWKAADRMSHGVLVLGDGVPTAPTAPLATHPVRLLVDGEVAFDHKGGNNAGDPTRLLVWLANHLRDGVYTLRAGDVVTTGSATPFLKGLPGQAFRAEFPGLGFAEMTIER